MLGMLRRVWLVIVVVVFYYSNTDRQWHMCRHTGVFGCLFCCCCCCFVFYYNNTDRQWHMCRHTGVFFFFTTIVLTDINHVGVFSTVPLTYWHMCRQTGVFLFFTTIVLTGINTCGFFFDNATELLTYVQTDNDRHALTRVVQYFVLQLYW